MALRLLVVAGLAAVLAASASAASQKHAVACLKAHHVLVRARSPKPVTRYGVHVEAFDGFSFHGIPKRVYDNGSLIFERTAAAAVRAQHTLYSRLAAFEIKHANGHVSPYRIRLDLRNTEWVVGNVVVIWSNDPQSRTAKSVLRGCLR